MIKRNERDTLALLQRFDAELEESEIL